MIISLRKRRIRCPTRSKHRLYLPFVRQKRGGLPKGPLHVRRGGPSAGCARCLVRPKRSALPETVPRGEAIHISAPLSLGSARSLVRPIFLCCSLYHAPGLFPCLFILPLAGPASHPAYAPAATSPARYRAGRAKQHNHARNVKPLPPSGESEAGSARSLVRPIFLCCSLYLAPWRFPRLLSSPWPDLPAGARLLASFWQKKGRIFVPLYTVD